MSKPRRWLIAFAGLLVVMIVTITGVRVYRFERAISAVERWGGSVEFERPNWVKELLPRRPMPFVDSRFDVVLGDCDIDDGGLRMLVPHLAQLPGPLGLGLPGTNITDDGLSELPKCPHLSWLTLDGTAITDAGLLHLRRCASLNALSLSGTSITDRGLRHLAELDGLATLYVDDTNVSDRGLEDISGLKSMQYLSTSNTNVTDEGVRLLQAALPQLSVTDD